MRAWVQRKFVAGGLAVVVAIVASSLPVYADPGGDKSKVDKQLSEAQATLEFATAKAQEAVTAFNSANSQLPAAEQAVSQAQGRVIAAQVEAREAQRAAEEAQADLDKAQSHYDEAELGVKDERDVFDGFVRESYEGGYYMTAAAVLAVEGPEELVAALEYLDTLAAKRDNAVSDMKRVRVEIAEEKAAVTGKKREVDQKNEIAQQALAESEEEQAAAQAAEQNVKSLVSQRDEAKNVAEQERDKSQQQYDDLQAESERLAEELRAIQEQQRQQREQNAKPNQPPQAAPPNGGDGRLMKPVKGYKSSDFGQRYDPYYNRWQLHAGTDFAAPGGAPIYAASDGTVVRAGWNGGYGNYTCIYHGEVDKNGRTVGLATCYAHQSSIGVSKGEAVNKGEIIGKVGTTGASTGNHLHFEVRLNGSPVNPVGWL